MHVLEINSLVLTPEDGFLLGNGDISASVYQRPGQLVFRLGKGDVWDTRLDLSENGAPAHIDELKEALNVFGLERDIHKKELISQKPLTLRLQEICAGSQAMQKHPYPCPKPTAEFVLHYPRDLQDMVISQQLLIEKGRFEAELRWRDTVKLRVKAVIHPQQNRLSISFAMSGWNENTRYGGFFYGLPEPFPVYFSLFRPNDPAIQVKQENTWRECRHPFLKSYPTEKNPQLPPPEYRMYKEYALLCQRFPEDCRYENGFEYSVATSGEQFRNVIEENTIFLLPDNIDILSGEVCLGIASTPEDTKETAISLVRGQQYSTDCSAAENAAKRFFTASSFSCNDKLFERIWYSTLHAKRCTQKAGKIPPGLFLPSTLNDYSLWHGDYHSNYNYQSNFAGDFETNHFDTGDAYFTGIEGAQKLGRRIAAEYYGARGCCIQLTGFPFEPCSDPMGMLPLGRMVYMTGWVAAYFYRRWRYSLDSDWLKHTGYPALKDFALFYTDFLSEDENGTWHAYPSSQGEVNFTKENCYDQPQVLFHARYALYCAAETADVLKVDRELAAQWRHIAARLPFKGDFMNVPYELPGEFCGFDGKESKSLNVFAIPGTYIHDWYNGHLHFHTMTALRRKWWDIARDFKILRANLHRWGLPNGLLTAMARINYGIPGAWTESFGVLGVISDMLLQSWSGTIEVFPGWPGEINANFEDFRAEGAFRVGATLAGGEITQIKIFAEKGGLCRIRDPWGSGKCFVKQDSSSSTFVKAENGVFHFRTEPGETYRLDSVPEKNLSLR